MHAVHARVKYQENLLKEYKKHAENGTIPKRLKSMKSYPKMQSPKAQKRVNETYHQVECTVLDQAIQEIEKNLAAHKEQYQSLLQQRRSERQVLEGRKEKTAKISHHTRDLDVFGEPLEEDEEPENTDDDDNDDEGDDEDKDDGDDDDDNVSVNPWSELRQEVKDDMKTTLAEQEEEQERGDIQK
ncbi:hypothetical protein AWC38_SpisGene24627 [Stylophora pistillata]|uniref:Uncharacterized protein n=1 Tax=Stylophora pistillata TaxID=50429 RepID=A0A2B4R464_STYPI|nr:hypothetical protein AWC38_SpisGene24627 [Stylophora pistillata]